MSPRCETRWAAAFSLTAVLTLTVPLAAAEEENLDLRPADRRELEQVIAEGRTETDLPRPAMTLYVRDAALAASHWLAGLLDRYLPRFGALSDRLLGISSILLFVSLALLLGLILLRAGRRWRADRARPITPSPGKTYPPAPPPRSRGEWEAELRRRLDEGDLGAAMEALWWWLASSLLAGPAEASWTSRELIARAGRRDLEPQIRRFDRLAYGPEPASTDELLRLFHDLREAA